MKTISPKTLLDTTEMLYMTKKRKFIVLEAGRVTGTKIEKIESL